MDPHVSAEIEHQKQLRQIASKVDRHLANHPAELPTFRARIQPLAKRWKDYQQAVKNRDEAVTEHWKLVKKNPKLQDKSERSFEKKGWEWDRFYLSGLDSFGSNPINEMPAKYVPDVVASIKKFIRRNEKEKERYTENSSEHNRLKQVIAEQRQNLSDIRSEFDLLSAAQKKKAWIKTPPKKVIPNRPYVKFLWWRYINLDDEFVFGCWRPKLEPVPENPLERLRPTEEDYRDNNKPRELLTLPRPTSKSEEYERYYIFLSSVHDNCLPEVQQITEGIWPEDLAGSVWTYCELCFGDKTAFLTSALERIRQGKGVRLEEEAAGKSHVENPPPIETRGHWERKGGNLDRLRRIDSNSTRRGIKGDKIDLKRLKEYCKRRLKRPDLAETLYLENGWIKTTISYRSMFKEK